MTFNLPSLPYCMCWNICLSVSFVLSINLKVIFISSSIYYFYIEFYFYFLLTIFSLLFHLACATIMKSIVKINGYVKRIVLMVGHTQY